MNKLFPCNKREGIEGSICKNCGTSHTITEELLKKKMINIFNITEADLE